MFEKYITKYEEELLGSVVPFWENNCVDQDFGGYLTSLDRDGSVYDYEKYMWMQWRIVYMFSELYLSEYSKPEWLGIAKDGFGFLWKNGRDEQGRYYFALNRAGCPSIAPHSIFSDCFAAMGGASLFKATGDDLYREAALAAKSSYMSRLDCPKGRWEKKLAGHEQFLSLGHYMMLANLGAIMDDSLGGGECSEDQDVAVDAVLHRFWNSDRGLMFENTRLDGTLDLDSCAGRMLNPGHALETAWFVFRHLSRKGGSKTEIAQVAEIVKATLELGWDPQFGGIFYFMDALGKPHVELQWDMKLWWVHCEALLACLYAYKMTGDSDFLDWFVKIDEWTWGHFPDHEYGEWFGYLNRHGTPTHMLKGGKWKTFFHLPRFLLFSINLMSDIDCKVADEVGSC